MTENTMFMSLDDMAFPAIRQMAGEGAAWAASFAEQVNYLAGLQYLRAQQILALLAKVTYTWGIQKAVACTTISLLIGKALPKDL